MGHRLTRNLPPLAKAWRVHIPQASQTRADPAPAMSAGSARPAVFRVTVKAGIM